MRSSCKSLPLLFATIIEFLGNNCFNLSSVSNKCLYLLIISLTFWLRGLNSTENITEEIVMGGFFFFLATEREPFSISSYLILQFLDYVLLQLNKMSVLLLYFVIHLSRNMFFLNEELHLFGYR